MSKSIFQPGSFLSKGFLRIKNNLRYLLFFLPAIFSLTGYGQSNNSAGKNNNADKFTISGEIVGRDTGTVVLWFNNNNNNGIADTAGLVNGRFSFSGTVNRVCEAILWTNIKNRSFDDPSVVRFLLEPDIIHISKPNAESDAIIKGSEPQAEKEKWDKQKSNLLRNKKRYYQSFDSLNKLSKNKAHTGISDRISEMRERIDSVNTKIREADVAYIISHRDSYLSSYLLFQHRKKLAQDSVKAYYNAFSTNVKNSSVGHDVLRYIYPLTDDQEFRRANTLVDKKFDQQLFNIKSLHDLSLKDSSGNIVDFNSFKGKYLVLDFWASWCKPCIENIPAWGKLIKTYDPDSVQFISISLDTDVMPWKRSLNMHKPPGIQVIDPRAFSGLLAVYGKVLFVPTFIVADRNGKIVKYNAPQPVEPELKHLLDNLLK